MKGGTEPRPIKGWAEQDVYTGWRKVYCYVRRPGVVKSIKRMTHKRERREGKNDIRREVRDSD